MTTMTMPSANFSSTWTPSGSGHGVDNFTGTEPLVFMALIVNE